MTTIQLRKPITAHGETIAELNLREPTVKDVAELGIPFRIVSGASGTGIDLLPKTLLAYGARLAAVPPSSLEALSLPEFFELQIAVMGFFGEELASAVATPQP